MSADGVCAFLVIHNATLWHQKNQEINATIIATVTESKDNQSLAELYASVCETGVADTLVWGSCCLLRRTRNQPDFAYTGCVEYSFHTLTLQRSRCEEPGCNDGTAIFCERSRDGSPGRSREGRWTGWGWGWWGPRQWNCCRENELGWEITRIGGLISCRFVLSLEFRSIYVLRRIQQSQDWSWGRNQRRIRCSRFYLTWNARWMRFHTKWRQWKQEFSWSR